MMLAPLRGADVGEIVVWFMFGKNKSPRARSPWAALFVRHFHKMYSQVFFEGARLQACRKSR
jgi:hypothetical protein